MRSFRVPRISAQIPDPFIVGHHNPGDRSRTCPPQGPHPLQKGATQVVVQWLLAEEREEDTRGDPGMRCSWALSSAGRTHLDSQSFDAPSSKSTPPGRGMQSHPGNSRSRGLLTLEEVLPAVGAPFPRRAIRVETEPPPPENSRVEGLMIPPVTPFPRGPRHRLQFGGGRRSFDPFTSEVAGHHQGSVVPGRGSPWCGAWVDLFLHVDGSPDRGAPEASLMAGAPGRPREAGTEALVSDHIHRDPRLPWSAGLARFDDCGHGPGSGSLHTVRASFRYTHFNSAPIPPGAGPG